MDSKVRHIPRSVALKLRRASRHLDEMDAMYREWSRRQAQQVVELRNASGLDVVYQVASVEPIPERFETAFGDLLFNLRAALDNLAYAIFDRLLGPEEFTPKMQERVSFPIYAVPANYRSDGRKHVKKLPAAVLALFDSLQPFRQPIVSSDIKTTDLLNHYSLDQVNDSQNRTQELLGVLSALNNIDKHRRLNLVEVGSSRFWPYGPVPDHIRVLPGPTGQPLRAGSELGTVFSTDPLQPDTEVSVKFRFRIRVREDVRVAEVMPLGMELRDAVVRVVERFEPYLDPRWEPTA